MRVLEKVGRLPEEPACGGLLKKGVSSTSSRVKGQKEGSHRDISVGLVGHRGGKLDIA